jgi:dihydropteroate synthase
LLIGIPGIYYLAALKNSDKVPKDTIFYHSGSLRIRGKLLSLDQPLIMGILNLTPDSFFEGSRIKNNAELLLKAGKMLDEGAAILDLGGYSTRPGAEDISIEKELGRVIPAIELIHKNFPEAIISVDTFRGDVAKAAVKAGASIINDISSGTMDPGMIPAVKELKVPYILMHIQGTPQDMHLRGDYEDVTSDVIRDLSEKIKFLNREGIHDIIIDPGFGFGKKIHHNFQLLNELERFKVLGYPLLTGISRKSFIYKTLGTTAENALAGTIAMNTIALMKGAKILRVHDVAPAREIITLYLKTNGESSEK